MSFEALSKKYANFDVPSYRISIDGVDILKKYLVKIANVTFEDAVDASHMFSFTVDDTQLKWLDSGVFEPSKIVEIEMGYQNVLSSMIVGEIVSFRPSFPTDGSPQIEISGYDLFYQFTRSSKNKTWKGKKDSEVVEEVLKSGQVKHKLTYKIEPTQVVRPEIVQDGETDYAFMKKLAERNFFDFLIDKKNIYFGPPKKNVQPVTTLQYGKSLLSFTSELNTANQVSEVHVRGWDPSAKKEIVGKAKSANPTDDNSGGAMMANLYGKVEQRITDRPVYSQQEADTLARALFNKLSVGLVRGNAECVGIPEIRAGETIILNGLGQRLSQKYFIEKSTHSMGDSGYRTTFSVRGDVI
jgi:phage protein D